MGRNSRKSPEKIADEIMKDKNVTDEIVRAMTFDSANDANGFSFFIADSAEEKNGTVILKSHLFEQPYEFSADSAIDADTKKLFAGGVFSFMGESYVVCRNGENETQAKANVLRDIIAEFAAAKKIHRRKDVQNAIKTGKEKQNYFLANNS